MTNVRNAVAEDLQAVIGIQNECELSEWLLSDMHAELNRSDSIFLVATDSTSEIIGFILGRILPGNLSESFCGEIYNLGVVPTYRRKGVGLSLVRSFASRCKENQVKEIFLEVRSSNKAAIDFYKKLGFTPQFQRPSFYRNPTDDATVMRATT